jgi:hypothetical protein
LSVVDGSTRPEPVSPVELSPTEVVWRPAVAEFQMSRITVDSPPDRVRWSPSCVGGPQVLLCASGSTVVSGAGQRGDAGRGRVCFMAGGEPATAVGRPGAVFRAAVGVGPVPGGPAERRLTPRRWPGPPWAGCRTAAGPRWAG